jgi:hypothetical protein
VMYVRLYYQHGDGMALRDDQALMLGITLVRELYGG